MLQQAISARAYTADNNLGTKQLVSPRLVMDLRTFKIETVRGGIMARIESTGAVSLDRAAADRFCGIPGVEEVRREDLAQGIVFWVRGSNLSDEALDAIIDAKWSLVDEFPERPVHLEIVDRFGRGPLHSSFWENLPLVRPATYLSATTSAGS